MFQRIENARLCNRAIVIVTSLILITYATFAAAVGALVRIFA
jgi:hypothetical protein